MSAELLAKLEPEVAKLSNHLAPELTALFSIAVSMKRIADALNECNDYGEVGGKALARAIRDGLRGHD